MYYLSIDFATAAERAKKAGLWKYYPGVLSVVRTYKDMLQTIQLKALCWPEELAGMAENKLDIDEEYSFWIDWMHTGIENNDVRSLLGTFENDKMLRVVFASYSEKEDSYCGIELN